MLVVICSRCESKRVIENLEALPGARFCDICGQQSVLVQANVHDMLTFFQTERSHVATQEQTRKEQFDKQEKLRTHIEAQIVRQIELESKCADLTRRELEINQRISDEEKKLKSEEENLQRLKNQTSAAHHLNQSLENERQKVKSDIVDKTASLRELEARIEDVTKRQTELIEKATIQETKLQLIEDQFQQVNKNLQELNQERQSLETKDLELSEAGDEKTARLRELNASVEVLKQHTHDLKSQNDRETKLITERESELRSIEGQIKKSKDRVQELQNTATSLTKRRQELEEANSMLVKQNQELDKLLQNKSGSIQMLTDEEQLSKLDGTPSAVARREAHSLEWLGIVAKYRKEYDQSEMHFRKALEIRERLGDELDAAFTLDLLVGLAKGRKQYAKAREYALKARQIHMRTGDEQSERRISDELNSIRDLERATIN